MTSACEYYDAVVIGAGPAGSTAAKRLGQAGLKVTMLEQRLEIGNKVQCAEFVPLTLSPVLRKCDIAQRVEGIKTFINGKLTDTLYAPGYILNRKSWDKYQADMAKTAGVSVMSATSAIAVEDNRVIVAKGGLAREINTKFILGCDGPNSLLRNKLGNERQESCVALQYEMMLNKPMEHAEIHFNPDYFGGYAWAFPKGKTINVGIVTHASVKNKLKCLLNEFYRKLILRQVIQSGMIVSKTGGLIPSGGLVGCLAKKNMLLAGDAAGCTHPITGAGIMNAVISGQMAAMAVIQHVIDKNEHMLAEDYTHIVTAEYGKTFALANEWLHSRNMGWTSNEEKFFTLIRRSWIAFPEYYEQQ